MCTARSADDKAQLAHRVVLHTDVDIQIGRGQTGGSLLGPFGNLQAGAGKQLPKTRVLPFARVVEAVEIEVPDIERTPVPGVGQQRIGFDHRIGGAFDAALHPQRAQQMAREAGLAGTKLTMQCDETIADFMLCRQQSSAALGVGLVLPDQCFYNRLMVGTLLQVDGSQLVSRIEAWSQELGFSQIGVSGIDLSSAEPGLLAWLEQGFHGEMAYMAAHGLKRARPAELVPGTASVLTLRLDYLPEATPDGWQGIEFARLQRAGEGTVSLYARGRDYHKVLRQRLQQLVARITAAVGPFGHRVFTDSAPVLEVELAVRSGQGWRGKHTLVLNREAGSMFFLGEIFLDMALPSSPAQSGHCGTCSACIDVCPTQAIVAPYRLDARRCIAYLSIEHPGSIPEPMRPLMGNRIYGCDDCQLACPWNKFAQRSPLPDFDSRADFGSAQLRTLFSWSEQEFLQRTEGSAIRRIGHERWLRNVAVAMGNALAKEPDPEIERALRQRALDDSAIVREHVAWALGYYQQTHVAPTTPASSAPAP